METFSVPVSTKTSLRSDAASVLSGPQGIKIARVSSSAADSGDSGHCQLSIATVAGDASCDEIIAQLPPGCSRVAWLQWHSQQPADSDSTQALVQALTDRGIGLTLLEARTQQLRGLAHWWFTAGQHCQTLWHASPPPCEQVVTHLPSWCLINDRLGRRILRHGPPSDTGAGPAIVAELGPHELSLHRIDSDLSVTSLVREPFLGYQNLMGLARLSAVPCGESSLQGLLESAAKGSLAKLDLTIGDLLPAESAYGNYDPNSIIYTLGKLHDLKSLDELQPSRHDVAASLTYTFIKTFFDTVVHATSAHGIPRVLVAGEFFQSECCRVRLLEAWNFTALSKDALKLHFLRQDSSDLLTLTGGLL